MKNIFILTCFLFNSVLNFAQNIRDFSAEKFNDAIKNNIGIILDVRTSKELNSGIIKNASTIDFYDKRFKSKASKIQKEKTIFVYCRSGSRSYQACKILIDLGFTDVVNLKGGVVSWKKLGYPLEDVVISDSEENQQLSVSDFEQVLRKNNVVFIDFHTLWCVPCRKLSPVIEALKNEYKSKILIERVNIDNNIALSNFYNINSVPTLVLFKNSKEIWRYNGIISKFEIKKLLDTNL